MSYTNFLRRNLGFFRLAVITNLEYRVNFITDAVLQPFASTLIELTLWIAVFQSIGQTEIGGFGRDNYLAYTLWGGFIARITSNWMYEFRMINDIESGAVNGLLARPTTFFEYYLSQFMGYKFVTTAFSLVFPLAAVVYFQLPTDFSRLPAVLALVFYYLFLVHTLSFCVCTLAFRLNKVSGFTMAKNLGLWLLSGELLPLDLFPEPWRAWIIAQPFANAVYIPVGYLTGRIGPEVFIQGIVSNTIGILFFALLGALLWNRGLRTYSGTGA